MHGSHETYFSSSLESNNNADKMPPFSQCYGTKPGTKPLMKNFCGLRSGSFGINREIVNRIEQQIECNVGCNVSNLTSKKLAPINCGQLSAAINDQATVLRLRSEVPHLTRKDVAKIRLPFFELLCHELLENGYHYAFSEMFSIYQTQNEERSDAGPESALWYIPPLSEQSDKMRLVAHHLTEAEAASRRGDAHTVFTMYLQLGLSFLQNSDDQWLSEHFFKHALEAAVMIKDDDGLKLALAHEHYGQILQARGKLAEASVSLQEFHRLTRDKLWKNNQGQLLQKLASTLLVENYQRQIDECPPDYHSDRIELCHKAQKIAVECDEWKVEAPVSLRLGELLEAAGSLNESLSVRREFFEKACMKGDYLNLGRVCEALAKLCHRMNKMEESIKYLQKFAQSCERHGQWLELGRACQMLGTAYDTVGDYTSALKWMKKSYNLPRMIQGLKPDLMKETTEAARIMIGVSRAHLMHDPYAKNLLQSTSKSVHRVVKWKADPKDEEKLFDPNELNTPPVTFITHRPKRDILQYAHDPVTGFLHH
ncbi:hypothetical protein CRM22_009837 [Opisthorchis felineus]|uniref:Tetratricopeptide repeat protein 29 n=1 Tax=Opisthorchis felineus TaxID=147828 RepID=A0A4S2LBW6_OPIFE|nr:hypothetical protein CRM22_009837 [Opisthorchis felineus]